MERSAGRGDQSGAVGAANGTESDRLAHRAGQDLAWVQDGWWQPSWELRAGDVGLLRLTRAAEWPWPLVAHLDGERVVFGSSLWKDTAVRGRDRTEVARLHRTGMRLDEDSERLEMSRWWGTGRLDYAGGERTWMKRAPWVSRWTLLDDRGRELAAIEQEHALFVTRGTMRLTPRAAERRTLALLVTFAWWIVTREVARQHHAAGAH